MKLKIEITMNNAAFDMDPGIEAARILRELGEHLEGGGYCSGSPKQNLRDLNGNTVGFAKVTR